MKPIYAIISSYNSCFGIIRISMGKYGFLINNIIYSLTKKTYCYPRYANKINIYYKNKIIDDGILIYYPEPHSYTGESCLEFFLHNNTKILYKVVKKIDKIFKRNKIKLYNARNGEFTFRSYINKKIDIYDVETIYNKIINIDRKNIIKYSLRNKNKKKFFNKINNKIDNLILYIENSIVKDKDNLEKILYKTKKIVKNCKLISKKNFIVKNTLKISIIGNANVGKSALFNFILKKNRSIVYNKSGTTRDIICENLNFNDINIKLFDTTGINLFTTDKVEKIGIKKTIKTIKKSDILIEIITKNNIKKFNSDITIFNKIDKSKIKKKLGVLYTSIKYKIGINEVIKKIKKISILKIKKKNEKLSQFYNINISKKIKFLIKNIETKDISIILSILKDIKSNLGYKNKNILNIMLKKFCIGK